MDTFLLATLAAFAAWKAQRALHGYGLTRAIVERALAKRPDVLPTVGNAIGRFCGLRRPCAKPAARRGAA